MFNLATADILSELSGKHIIPAAQRLIGLMEVHVTDAQIVEAVRTPVFMIRDPLSYAVREVVRRLYQIFAADGKLQ